jgi:hypothetical protein
VVGVIDAEEAVTTSMGEPQIYLTHRALLGGSLPVRTTWVPTRRASGVDPVICLGSD